MMNQSVYERIRAGIGADGKLPYTFSLEEKPAPNQVGFMPGAMDGIGVFHMGNGNEKNAVKEVASLLKKYIKKNNDKYITKIESILTGSRAISIIDPVLQSIRDDRKKLNPNAVFDLAQTIVKTSGNIELVKIGLGLLGLFDLGGSDEIEDVVLTLALYDDFTLFAVVAVSNWTNGNGLIYKISRQVSGWGKIHAVERLEPENEEIREWILRDGCSNSIMDAYLGLTCAVKGDMISALRQEELDNSLFDSIAVIIDVLLDEGPVDGISEYEHAGEALILFTNHAKRYADNVEHLWRILNLRDWAEFAEAEYKDEIISRCDEIIRLPDWKDKILDALNGRSGGFALSCATGAANRMGIDISAELFALVKDSPLEHSWYMSQLLKNPSMADEIISLCENILPLDEMATGMGDYLFADTLNKEHQCLDFILPELAAYPLQGVSLIKTGLNSRVVRGRNMACRALSGWVKSVGKPLAELSPEVYSEIIRIHAIEVNEQAKETMKKLIDGGFEGP